MKWFNLLWGIVFMVWGNCAFAQNSLLMGSVVDKNDKPVSGAIIKVSKGWQTIETRSAANGLFYTKLMPSGTYHIDVFAGNKYVRAKKVYFYAGGTKKYYILRMGDDKLDVDVTENDIFGEAHLSRAEAE